MAIDYSNSAIIEGVKGKINVPAAQGLYADDTAFLNIIDRELRSRVIAFVLSLRQDYLLVRYPLTLVSGQTAYDLPDRMFTPAMVNYLQGTDEYALSPIDPGSNYNGYYFLNEKIILPVNRTYSSIVLYYYRRPGFLVPTTSATQFTAVASNVFTSVGTLDSRFVANAKVDVIEGTPPFRAIDDNLTIQSVTSNTVGTVTTNTITLTTTPSTTTATTKVGDWLAIQNESPLPQIPYEAFHYLEMCSALRIVLAGNYQSQAQALMSDIKQIEHDLKSMLVPRIERDSKRFTKRPFSLQRLAPKRFFS